VTAVLPSPARIAQIADNALKARGGDRDTAVLVNALCMAEEMSEAVQEIRRHLGHARRPATLDQVAEEMADVVIATLVTADLLGIDMAAAINHKLATIEGRGGL
jgi:NTP pyrophosphatase (non-canonical NTP hydrolase)